ncbi:MAG TPA: aldo/keto reductase [Thermoanaerobaculia bacterium]|nr:aldo/keto reductase [Thermoanaerobaculia bacterium]
MQQVKLGRTGIEISAIGFGGMPLSIKGRPDERESRAVINASLDNGVTFIDTADVYCLTDDDIGHNERLIAATLRDRKNGEVVQLATKGGLRRPDGEWTRDGSPRHLREACEASLRALGVERIFLYQLHAPDPETPFEKSVETLAELQRKGKIEHVGLSNVSTEQIARASEIVEVQSVQNRLSTFFREAIDEGVVEACQKGSITFLAYSPLGGGRLAKTISAVQVLKEIGRTHNASPGAVMLAWVRSKGSTVVPIPGASKIENAIDSARAADLSLSGDEVARIDQTRFSRD